jgi:hypothetical protein
MAVCRAIKSTILMNNALIFKEEAKVMHEGLIEKGSAKPHYSTQQIEGYDLLCFKEKIRFTFLSP